MRDSSAAPLILVVEDEADLAATVEYNLRREHMRTRSAASVQEALAGAAEAPRPDLVLLDLMLPDGSGVDVCRALRADPATAEIPILMVTALTAEAERVAGFEAGADDYVTKPYSVRELLLRVKAVLRRAQAGRESGSAPESTWTFGVLEVDEGAHQARVEGAVVPLTALEFRLLRTLADRRGRVQTRDQLLEDVWGYSPDLRTRTVDTHMKRLRRKLGAAAEYIETVRGVGYRFRSRPGGPS